MQWSFHTFRSMNLSSLHSFGFRRFLFAGLSSEAKILYGLMLDRVGLYRKNGWIDQNGNVYIQYTIEEMMSVLKWTRYRIYQLLDELDTKENGIGLIERKRVGLNKPNLIYVKNFASVNRTRGEPEVREPEFQKSASQTQVILIEIRMKRVILILFL